MRGSKYHYERAITVPPTKRHLNGGSLAGRWWPTDSGIWLPSFPHELNNKTSVVKVGIMGKKLDPSEKTSGSAHVECQSKTQIRLCGYAGWSESSMGAHTNLHLLLVTGWYTKLLYGSQSDLHIYDWKESVYFLTIWIHMVAITSKIENVSIWDCLVTIFDICE